MTDPHRRRRRDNLLALGLAGLAVASISLSSYSLNRQLDCTSEFKRVISERATEVQAYDNAVFDLVSGLFNLPPREELGAEAHRAASLARYEEFREAYETLRAERAANPYPDADC